MFESMFFGTYVGVVMGFAILINDVGKSTLGAALFVLLSTMII